MRQKAINRNEYGCMNTEDASARFKRKKEIGENSLRNKSVDN